MECTLFGLKIKFLVLICHRRKYIFYLGSFEILHVKLSLLVKFEMNKSLSIGLIYVIVKLNRFDRKKEGNLVQVSGMTAFANLTPEKNNKTNRL